MSLGNVSKRYFTLLIMILFLLISTNATMAKQTNSSIESDPKTIEVILQTHYLDGEMSEEMVVETIWSMEDFWSYYHDWQLVDQNEEKVVFKKDANDISPLLKMNGYFGLSEDGTFNIYNGKPNENEVIQSFFQVNTSRLKSHLHEELLKGIPISTKDNYLEVLQLVEEFAIQEL